MSRTRKLYLSELLIRSVDKDLALQICKPYEIYFDDLYQAINYLKDTNYWYYEVDEWLQAKWYTKNKRGIHTLYVKLK